jgi:ribosomal protein S18 acetylase RimI-like enzyme
MEEKQSLDWDTELKEIPVKEWETRFNWVEDPCISPDGEQIASIVNVDEMLFGVCVNGEVWEGEYEKAWNLRALPNNTFAACICQDEEWTLAVNGKEWSNRFDFIWDLQIGQGGSPIGLAFQSAGEYGMVVDDTPWDTVYPNISGMVLGEDGTSAAAVQVEAMAAADVAAFKRGVFTVARNGKAFEQTFLNVWDISLDEQCQNLAWGARLTREGYTIVLNGRPWENYFQSVWKPEFVDQGTSIVAPVRQGGKWRLFKDDQPFWKTGYEQLWRVAVSRANNQIAAIVSPTFGKWSVAQDDRVWPISIDTMVRDIYYSEDGSCLAAVLKNKGVWNLAVNGKFWDLSADKIFTPCISRDGSVVAVVIERNGACYMAVNNQVIAGPYGFMAAPVISLDTRKILVKGIENGIYKRRVLSLGSISEAIV